MTATRKTPKKAHLIKLIHIAKAKLGLSQDDYLCILDGATGKDSCSKMTTEELEKTLKAFKALGFEVKSLPVKEADRGRASEEQLHYIKGMWELVSYEKTERALNNFCRRITGVSHLRFLDRREAVRLTTALRAMMVKKGYDPDGIPQGEMEVK